MTEEQHQSQRGGRREGAGRPGSNSKLYAVRLPEPLAKVVDRQKNKTDFIKGCIVHSLMQDGQQLRQLGEVYKASQLDDIHLPFFDISIVAGFPIPLDNDERAQNINLLRMLCPNSESCYLIRVQGNSMIDAGIYSGDIVIVDKSIRNPTEKQVAVCEFNGEYTLKHFVKRDGCGWLVPDNPDYPEIRVGEEDSFSVWGTVTYVIHKPG